MKRGSYSLVKAKFLSKFNLSEVNISDYHYNRLIEESCLRSTGLERRMKIKDELKVIRILRRDKNEKRNQDENEIYNFSNINHVYVCD